MFGILFRVKAKPGEYQELVKFLKWDGEVCRDKEPGTLRFEFYPDPSDKDALYVYEAYRDKNAFEEHKRNEPYQQWVSVVKPKLVEEHSVLFECDAVWLPEVKEKKTTNTPVTQSDIEQFIRDWFGKLDIHPPVEEMLPFLADEKLVMKMPGKTYCRYEGFKAWYEDIGIKYDEQVHIIRGLQITLAQDTAKVEIVVQWQRSEKNAIDDEKGRKGFYAAQTWEVERSPQTQRLVIVTYNVAYFVPMVTMNNVSKYEKEWIDGLNQGDVSVADKVFASGCNIHIIESQTKTLAEFKDMVKKDLFECPGMQFTIEDQIIAGDKNVFRWVANGLCEGKPTQVEGLILDQVENGKVVERWETKQIFRLTPDKCCTIVPYYKVMSGKLDEFKGLCKELVERTSKEAKCLYYGFSFDEHNEYHAHCREGYADAEGVQYHLDSVSDLLTKVAEIAETYRLEIHGPEGELEKLKNREDIKWFNPMFFTLEHGFRKLIVQKEK